MNMNEFVTKVEKVLIRFQNKALTISEAQKEINDILEEVRSDAYSDGYDSCQEDMSEGFD